MARCVLAAAILGVFGTGLLDVLRCGNVLFTARLFVFLPGGPKVPDVGWPRPAAPSLEVSSPSAPAAGSPTPTPPRPVPSPPAPGIPPMTPAHKFYVYYDIDWLSVTCRGDRWGETPVRLEELWATNKSAWNVKHSDDFWFLRHALASPFRTHDPEAASLFVVAGLVNLLTDQKFWTGGRCCVGRVCDWGLVEHMHAALDASKWFRRSKGRDHVLVASHYGAARQILNMPAFWKCNWLAFERNWAFGEPRDVRRIGRDWVPPQVHDRFFLASTYVGSPCPDVRPKTHDMVFVGSMKFPHRTELCAWLKNQSLFSVALCGVGDQCPNLGLARLGMHVGGDTPGSKRLMDVFLAGGVPLVTEKAQYDILPPILPWRDMTLFRDRYRDNAQDRWNKGVAKALRKWQEVDDFNRANDVMNLLDWQQPHLFHRYMSHFESVILSTGRPA